MRIELVSKVRIDLFLYLALLASTSILLVGCASKPTGSSSTNIRKAESVEDVRLPTPNPLADLDSRDVYLILMGQEQERKFVIPEFQIDDQDLIRQFVETMKNAK